MALIPVANQSLAGVSQRSRERAKVGHTACALCICTFHTFSTYREKSAMPHALIIDDDADVSDTLTELVTAEGFSTATAHSLAEAREQLATPPDIILLDLNLPDGNGIDLL